MPTVQIGRFFVPLESRRQKQYDRQEGRKENPLKRKLIKSCRRLAREECANYRDGDCLPADRPCSVFPKTGGICQYFRNAVLPLERELCAMVEEKLQPSVADKANWQTCGDCKRTFIPEKTRQKFCPECSQRRKREKTRLRVQNFRERKHAVM